MKLNLQISVNKQDKLIKKKLFYLILKFKGIKAFVLSNYFVILCNFN